MSTSQKVLVAVFYTLLVASASCYLSPTKTVTVTKTETVVVTKTVEAINSHTKTVTRTRPDGTATTITISDNSSNTITDSDLETKTEITKEVTRASNGPSIGALVGLDITSPASGYFFAGQISFPVPILPVSLILQGATNKTAMLGLTLKLP